MSKTMPNTPTADPHGLKTPAECAKTWPRAMDLSSVALSYVTLYTQRHLYIVVSHA